jgi:PPOX class probable F420-dependent enzyme
LILPSENMTDTNLSPEVLTKLESQPNIWFSSVRPDGRPHLTPVWFVWHDGHFYFGIDPKSVKSRNIRLNPRVTLALEDGTHPVIVEGVASLVKLPLPESLVAAFYKKYEWNLSAEEQFNQWIEVTPTKWVKA